jgi:phospholipid-binding lipoprotein MlaA
MLNTILGLGGLIDVGTKLGMPERHDEDFGQTLAVYGVGEGPYLMVPLLGPSNPRDLAGRVVDLAFDPLSLLAPLGASLGRAGTAAVSDREANIESIEQFERTSIDLYAALRSVSRQHRANAIRNDAPAPFDDFPDLYDLK